MGSKGGREAPAVAAAAEPALPFREGCGSRRGEPSLRPTAPPPVPPKYSDVEEEGEDAGKLPSTESAFERGAPPPEVRPAGEPGEASPCSGGADTEGERAALKKKEGAVCNTLGWGDGDDDIKPPWPASPPR